MKNKATLRASIMAALLLAAATVPATALAGKNRSGGNGQGKAAGVTTRQQTRDGSCDASGATQTRAGEKKQKGNTWGPGDGTGNDGVGPKDGTGYGAPAQR